ncbi:MAG: hypothetical protein AAF587_30825 [Bacteroidota bacterium]
MNQLIPAFLVLLCGLLFMPSDLCSQSIANSDKPSVIHVFVALCDNANQGIVPVPASIGNGQDPHSNLYWGAGYGVRTYFSRSSRWKLIEKINKPAPHILERCIFKHTNQNVLLVADAYDGAKIREAIIHFTAASAGHHSTSVSLDTKEYQAGGAADLVAYVGHNGLMEFDIPSPPPPLTSKKKDAIMLACISKGYFSPLLTKTGANPLLWTTGLMAPEAYTLEAAIQGWIEGKTDAEVQQLAAAAYHKYQKCGLRGAGRLLVTGK